MLQLCTDSFRMPSMSPVLPVWGEIPQATWTDGIEEVRDGLCLVLSSWTFPEPWSRIEGLEPKTSAACACASHHA